MKYYHFFLIFIVAVILPQFICAQTKSKPVYVIVHGAWGGGWAFKEVDSLLTNTGNTVFRPTLTGQGERVHLANLDVGLKTHILDIVNTILYEELSDIILVGHSYGGMVITGVADSIPDRISNLVYIDAAVPENNESFYSIFNLNDENLNISNGHIMPSWVSEGQLPPKDVPHPLRTWKDSISLTNQERLKITTSYILTVKRGTDPKLDRYAFQAERAKRKGWNMFQLEADHNAQWSAPEEFVRILKEIESKF